MGAGKQETDRAVRRTFPHAVRNSAVVGLMLATATMSVAAEPMELPRLSRDGETSKPTIWDRDGKAGVDPHRSTAPTALVAGAAAVNDGTGTGWASVTLPGSDLVWQKASIDARVDPAQQAAVGVTLKRPIATTGGVALTVENSYSVTRRIDTPSPVSQAGEQPAQNWGTGGAVRLDINKTSLSVGTSVSSADNQWHNKVGLEREIVKGLSVSS